MENVKIVRSSFIKIRQSRLLFTKNWEIRQNWENPYSYMHYAGKREGVVHWQGKIMGRES